MADEAYISRNPYTITRWIMKEQQKYPNAKGDLTIILNSITLAIKVISAAAKGAGIFQRYNVDRTIDEDDFTTLPSSPIDDEIGGSFGDYAGVKVIDDDEDKKADDEKQKQQQGIREFAHETVVNSVAWCGKVSMILSTLNLAQPITVKKCEEPKYCLVFDPIDGKKNIDINASIGTIFAIYKVQDQSNPNVNDLLQSGDNMVCAGYALYGDATVVMLTFGEDVNGFTLDPTIGEFVLTHKNVRVPDDGLFYSINEGYAEEWDDAIKEYIAKCKKPNKGKPKKSRYIGCMVADTHRSLLKGGIYLYPTNKSYPNGKLSLQCECNPLTMIMTAAGGRASNGSENIGSIKTKNTEQAMPFFIGSKNDVTALEECYKKYKK